MLNEYFSWKDVLFPVGIDFWLLCCRVQCHCGVIVVRIVADSNPQDGAGPRTRRSGAPATRRPITTSSSSSIAAAVDEVRKAKRKGFLSHVTFLYDRFIFMPTRAFYYGVLLITKEKFYTEEEFPHTFIVGTRTGKIRSNYYLVATIEWLLDAPKFIFPPPLPSVSLFYLTGELLKGGREREFRGSQ